MTQKQFVEKPKYVRNKYGSITPIDKNIAIFHELTAVTICNYKKNKTAKYLELKREFKEALQTNKIK